MKTNLNKELIITKDNERNFQMAKKYYVCSKLLDKKDVKVKNIVI